MDIIRWLSGRHEREAIQRNIEAHRLARASRPLNDQLEYIDMLMRRKRRENGNNSDAAA